MAEELIDGFRVLGDCYQLQRTQFLQDVPEGDMIHGTWDVPHSLVRVDHVGVRCPFASGHRHVAPIQHAIELLEPLKTQRVFVP